MASGEKIRAKTRTLIEKFDGDMNLEDLHQSSDDKTQVQPVAQPVVQEQQNEEQK